jgi:hypothetical protein
MNVCVTSRTGPIFDGTIANCGGDAFVFEYPGQDFHN